MKKFRTQKLSKADVYVRYMIGAILIIFVLKSGITGFPFYSILIFTALLVLTGITGKSLLKAKFYPGQATKNNNED
ncbi:MAG TPA: hypothetical protein VFM72_07935 [Aequorivita sp.]|nr:hypothetical protein [Aequorivita sp.]